MIRRVRYEFWRLLARVSGAVYRFCRRRQARCCNCMACYYVTNQERIVRELVADVIREESGLPKIDRRPS